MTFGELAKKMGITQKKLSRYLNGANVPKSRIQDIADYFDVAMLDIIKINGFDY